MSFNLNKNEESSVPKGRTTFNLSKSSNQEELPVHKKPAYGLFGLFALLIVGVAAWFLAGGGATGTLPSRDTIMVPTGTADSAVVQPANSPAASQFMGNSSAVAKPRAESGLANNRTKHVDIARIPVTAASFSAGSVRPRNAVLKVMAQIRRELKRNNNLKINVFGYASKEGSLEVNQKISQARAEAYKDLLINKGISERNIDAYGRGIEKQIASNKTEAGRRKNRRVEVSF